MCTDFQFQTVKVNIPQFTIFCLYTFLYIHSLIPSFSFQTCESSFATKDRLRAHMIRHEEKVPCHICGKLLSAAYITDHMRVHNQSQHHACHLCNRSKYRCHNLKLLLTIFLFVIINTTTCFCEWDLS